MSLVSYTAKTWVEGTDPELTAANVQTIDDQMATNARLAGSIPETFAGLVLRTHPDASDADDKLILEYTGYLAMSDGELLNGWDQMTADLSVSGVGGLDSGSSRQASTWYEMHAIYDAAGPTQNLILTEADEWTQDQAFATNDGSLGVGDNAARQRLAQSFQTTNTGPASFVDLYLVTTGTPTDYLTVTIEADTAGDPSGTPLATGHVLDQAKIGTSIYWLRIVFRTPATLTATTTYWIVLDRSGVVDAANYVAWGTDSAQGYATGSMKSYDGAAWNAETRDANFRVYIETTSAALTLPAGYDASCKIGYARTDASQNWQRFIQMDRRLRQMISTAGTSTNTSVRTLVTDAVAIPPTPCIVSYRAAGDGAVTVELPAVWPVPDGYDGIAAVAEVAGGVQKRITAVADTEPAWYVGDVLTRTQGYYVSNQSGGDGTTIWAVEAQWLR